MEWKKYRKRTNKLCIGSKTIEFWNCVQHMLEAFPEYRLPSDPINARVERKLATHLCHCSHECRVIRIHLVLAPFSYCGSKCFGFRFSFTWNEQKLNIFQSTNCNWGSQSSWFQCLSIVHRPMWIGNGKRNLSTNQLYPLCAGESNRCSCSDTLKPAVFALSAFIFRMVQFDSRKMCCERITSIAIRRGKLSIGCQFTVQKNFKFLILTKNNSVISCFAIFPVTRVCQCCH